MRKVVPAANPQVYVDALSGWQAALVRKLRAAVRRAKPADEAMKWGHLVYFANGPVALIRAEESRVLFGFWRGKRLVELEPRLKPSGKYEMATIAFKQGDPVSPAKAAHLMRAAIALNETMGDPTAAAKAPKRRGRARG